MEYRVREVGDTFKALDGTYLRVVLVEDDNSGTGACSACYWHHWSTEYPRSRFREIGVCGSGIQYTISGPCATRERGGIDSVKFVKVEFNKNRESANE